MLVLSRRVGERLLIGDDIVLTVIEVRSDGVRLGIDAPRSVRVHRAEVLEAVTAANVEASAVTDADAEALQRLVPRPPAAGARAATPAPEAASSAEPHAGTEPAE